MVIINSFKNLEIMYKVGFIESRKLTTHQSIIIYANAHSRNSEQVIRPRSDRIGVLAGHYLLERSSFNKGLKSKLI